MNKEDLMIGDLFYWEAEGKRYQYQVKAEDFVKGEISNFQPIPLTPEILEKNGFRYSDLPFEDFYEGYGLQIHGGNYADGHSNWYIICGTNITMNVTHVHKLQHALKLCEIKKEIIL